MKDISKIWFMFWILTTLLVINISLWFVRPDLVHLKQESIPTAQEIAKYINTPTPVNGRDGVTKIIEVPSKVPGPRGADGADAKTPKPAKDGINGLSAYQIWLMLGNVGIEQDFINSLKGNDGRNLEEQCNPKKLRIEWRYEGDSTWQIKYYLPEGSSCPSEN